MQVSRQKSGTPVKDEKLIVPILFFAEWGFMDYVAARGLFLQALDASRPVEYPRKSDTASSLIRQIQNVESSRAASQLWVGNLVWPACALAATSVEKYCKAIVAIKEKKLPPSKHLTRSLIRQLGNAVRPGIFDVINRDFLEHLRELYDLRYPVAAKSPGNRFVTWLSWLRGCFGGTPPIERKTLALPRQWRVSVRGMLAELDRTIAELNGSIQVDPLNSFGAYALAVWQRTEGLYKENYFLEGKDKEIFWQQHDLQATITSSSDPTDTQIVWAARENRAGEAFFSVVSGEMDSSEVQAQRNERARVSQALSRELWIMRPVKKK